MGAGIGSIVVARLEDPRWYVTRNMLALLDELPAVPEGFSPVRYTLHADARVRWQAVKLQLKLPAERDAALATALKDREPRIMRLAVLERRGQRSRTASLASCGSRSGCWWPCKRARR